MRRKKIILSLSVIAIIFCTSFIFNQTQNFYKASIQGKRYFLQGEYQQALPYLTLAAKINPNDQKNLLLLLQAYANTDNKDKAKELASSLVERKTDKIEDIERIADVYYKIADYPMAEKLYRQILVKKETLNIKKKLAEVLIWQKKYGEGICLVKNLIKEQNQDLNLVLLLADVYSWAKKYGQAIKIYNYLLAKEFEAKLIMLKLADALRLSGRNQEAIELYNKYLANRS